MADIFNEVKDKLNAFFRDLDKIGTSVQRLPNRLYKIKRGFDHSGEGIKLQFINLGKSFALGGQDIGRLFQLLGETVYKFFACFYYIMGNMRCCFIFYLADFLGKLLYFIVPITVFTLRKFTGIDLRERIRQMHRSIDETDEMIYQYVGHHIAKFPDTVIKKCYSCPNHFSLNQSINAIKQQSNDIDVDFNRTIPDMMNEPKHRFGQAERSFYDAFH